MELCGGTHTRATGEIGLFRIVGENAIAAGVRPHRSRGGLARLRCREPAASAHQEHRRKINSPVHELEKKVEALLTHQKELEKQIKSAQQREAAGRAKDLIARARTIQSAAASQPQLQAIIENLGAADGDTLQSVADAIKASFKGVIILGGASNGAVALVASVSPEFTARVQAGKIIQTIAPIVGGKGGGKPDNARGGGKDASKLDEALAKATSLVSGTGS
jgi:alanyl-tRNA synthetase